MTVQREERGKTMNIEWKCELCGYTFEETEDMTKKQIKLGRNRFRRIWEPGTENYYDVCIRCYATKIPEPNKNY